MYVIPRGKFVYSRESGLSLLESPVPEDCFPMTVSMEEEKWILTGD